jgi:hypothetical protein
MSFAMKFTSLPGTAALIILAQPVFALTDHIPSFDVQASCKAAETYDVSEDRQKTFKGCMQDEDKARGLISKNWGHYKVKDRVDCVTQGEKVAPSYVEILTCLEMSDDTGALLSKDVNQPTGNKPGRGKSIDASPAIAPQPGDTVLPK